MADQYLEQHLDADWIQWYSEQDANEYLNQRILHQLQTCEICYQRYGYILDLYRNGKLPGIKFDYLDVFLAYSRFQAKEVWAEVSPKASKPRRDYLLERENLCTWGMVELLCDLSLTKACQNPEEALEIAKLAVEVSDRVSGWERAFSERDYQELQQLAWCHKANAHRVLDELHAADSCFCQPQPIPFKEGSELLQYRQQVLSLRASLRIDQRRFSDAALDLDWAEDLVVGHSPRNDKFHAKLLIQRGTLLFLQDQSDAALAALRDAILLASGTDERLEMLGRWNELSVLNAAGRTEEIRSCLPAIEVACLHHGGETAQARILWQRGRIAETEGDLTTAIDSFRSARTTLLGMHRAFDSTLVGLDLALAFLKSGQFHEVEIVAADIIQVARSTEIHREALSALLLFQHTTCARLLSEEFLRELVNFLAKSQSCPHLEFDPTSLNFEGNPQSSARTTAP